TGGCRSHGAGARDGFPYRGLRRERDGPAPPSWGEAGSEAGERPRASDEGDRVARVAREHGAERSRDRQGGRSVADDGRQTSPAARTRAGRSPRARRNEAPGTQAQSDALQRNIVHNWTVTAKGFTLSSDRHVPRPRGR